MRSLFLLFIATGCFCLPAFSESWQDFYDRGNKASEQGHYSEALPALTRALSLAEESGGEHLAETLNSLGDCHYGLEQYSQAEKMHRRALTIVESENGRKSIEYAGVLNALGLDLYREDKSEEAQPLLKQALAIYDKDKAGNGSEILDVLNTLGRVSSELDKRSDAISYFKRAISQAEKLDPNGEAVAENLECLAEVYTKYDQNKKAVSMLTRAVQLRGSQDSPALADCLLALGVAQDLAGQSEDALPTLTRALAVYEAVSGKESLDVAATQEALASLVRDQGDYKTAENFFRSALAIREKVSGPEDPGVAACSLNLGILYKSLGNYATAQTLIARAATIDQKKFGTQSKELADDLTQLAQCMLESGKYEAAGPIFRRAISIYSSEAPSSDEYLACLEGQAKLYRCTKRVAEAEALERQCETVTGSIERLCLNQFLARPITNKWAVCVGISKFADSSNDLDWAAKDAADLAGYLVHQANFEPSHVCLLQDSQATRANILNVIGGRWLPENVHEDDLVVIFISSHGSEALSEEGGYNFLLCYDTNDENIGGTAVPMQELMRMIKRRIRAHRVIVVLDACHSGASATDARRTRMRGNFDAVSLAHEAGQVILCSSKPGETSTDSSEFKNGLFTHFLLEGLALRKEQTTLGEAFAYLQKKVIEYSDDDSDQQTPVMKGRWNAENIKLAAPVIRAAGNALSPDNRPDD